jgi:hypothetical protein
MWKVKRMNTAPIVVLASAFDGGGLAAILRTGRACARSQAEIFLAGRFISSATEIPNSTTTQTWPKGRDR